MDADQYHHPHHRTGLGSKGNNDEGFTSIKDLRDAAQTISDKTLNDVVIQFNEATVVAVMKMETKRSNQQNSSIHFCCR